MDATKREQAGAGMQYEISADRREVSLQLPTSVLSAADLERLLVDLGRLRASMTPPAHDSLLVGPGSAQYMDFLAAWGMAPDQPLPTEHGAVFMGCSSAYGWFHFPASPEFCQQLAKWLTTDGSAHGVQEARRAAH
ncbi:hypothetical protein [Pseudorhodoferax sp.]|uniref:hypothetical protein n=1 Tax=Pseudorhodoferax sp. TaxID=1993553 RepID=UPI002DD61B52|nr:hypothetical protein [Pseudorhodoferax sp.]